MGIVEWAPSQRTSTKRVSKAKTADPNKCGTILAGLFLWAEICIVYADKSYKSFAKKTETSDAVEVDADPAQLKTVEQMVGFRTCDHPLTKQTANQLHHAGI